MLQNQKSNAECSPLLAGSDGEMMAMMRNLGLQKPTKREKRRTNRNETAASEDRESRNRGLNL